MKAISIFSGSHVKNVRLQNMRYNVIDSVGICPFCGKEINKKDSTKECFECKKKVKWTSPKRN